MSTVVARTRSTTGKGPAHRSRLAGLVPGVIYGRGVATREIEIDPKPLRKALDKDFGVNTVLGLELDGVTTNDKVMVQDFQKHPVTGDLLHIDFRVVQDDTPITAELPLVLSGRPLGVRQGGELVVFRKRLLVKTTPKALRPAIEWNIEHLEGGVLIRLKDLKLPEGIAPASRENFPVLTIRASRAAAAEAEAAAAPAKGAAPAKAAPAAKAPAAPAKK